jgi:hypothetical protein
MDATAAPTLVSYYPGWQFVAGAITAGNLVCSLFFLRFWRRTGDSLFVVFSLAFLLLAVNQGLVVLVGTVDDNTSLIYLLRLAAFALIILAIIRKNIGRGSSP